MNEDRIAAIEARLYDPDRTYGPWCKCDSDNGFDVLGTNAPGTQQCVHVASRVLSEADANLIANAPDDLAFLLSEVERLSSRSEPDDNYSGDVEYHVPTRYGRVLIYEHVEDAGRRAFLEALAHGEATVDVVVCSEEGARSFGGDDAVDEYNEDPEASVFERMQIRLNNLGRVP